MSRGHGVLALSARDLETMPDDIGDCSEWNDDEIAISIIPKPPRSVDDLVLSNPQRSIECASRRALDVREGPRRPCASAPIFRHGGSRAAPITVRQVGLWPAKPCFPNVSRASLARQEADEVGLQTGTPPLWVASGEVPTLRPKRRWDPVLRVSAGKEASPRSAGIGGLSPTTRFVNRAGEGRGKMSSRELRAGHRRPGA